MTGTCIAHSTRAMEPFQRVDFHLVPDIVAALQPDGCHSIVPCQMLQMHAECKKALPSIDMRLYTPAAKVDPYGTFLLYIPEHRGCIVFHTLCNDEELLLQRISEVDINYEANAWLGPIHERFQPLIHKLIERKGLTFLAPLSTAYNLSISRNDALNIKGEVKEVHRLRPITVDDAEFIDSRWPHRDDTTLHYVRNNILVRDGLALCHKETGEMLSWSLFCLVGGIGMTQTAEQHRGKGYAGVVARELTRIIAESGVDPQVQVNTDLHFSYRLFLRIGYQITHHVQWYRLRRI